MTWKRPVAVGTIVTAVATGVFLALPFVVQVVTGDPEAARGVKQFRFLGGAIGGFVAGALTTDPRRRGAGNGIRAAMAGLLLLFVVYVAISAGRALWAGRIPPIMAIIVPVLIVSIPLAGAHFVGGLVAGILGRSVRTEIDR